MNAILKQLADEAGADIWGDQEMASRHFDIEKFAELIIDQCVRACVEDVADPRDTVELQCAQKIKRKFGVE